ncbi:MAG: amylo-alpha-1,6-glucosidase [Gemmatimonadetes bacterium]|nr:amylo-alpha-1,6-glucosidase [Gemmatimonadota bacterium]
MSDSVAAPAELELVPIAAPDLLGYGDIACETQTLVRTELVLKEGSLFLLTDASGNVTPAGACELGLFHEDTRVLSYYDLVTAGGRPDVLSSQAARVFVSQIDLTVTDREFGGVFTEPKNFLHIRREQLLSEVMHDRLVLTNYLGRPVDFWIELRFAADYADIFEVRGAKRARRGQYYRPRVGTREVVWAYRGLDDRLRQTMLHFSIRPTELEEGRARWAFHLHPKDSVEMEVVVAPLLSAERPQPADRPMLERFRRLRADYDGWRNECTRIRADDEFFNAAVRQAITDVRALLVDYGGRTIVTAGIPWFTTPFGRDSAITGIQALPINPAIARQTLDFLAAHQGRETSDWTEEEPGKILHEIRRGEMAACQEVPHVPYYGSVDATPLFLVLLGETLRWTADLALVRRLLPHVERALHWIDHHGDLDGDGLVEYARRSPRGLVNQGWKDSGDGVAFPDGTLPEPPIALVEVQGYVYAAKMHMAEAYAALGDLEQAGRLRAEAAALRQRIQDAFWLEDRGYFALALNGEKRAIPTITSNPGHLLWSGVPTPEQARRMAEVLLGPELFSGWGIRTVARHQPIYNPLSYHNGTIWPHDNSIIALGLARYGLRREAATVLGALFDAALHFRYYRLPELFCGIWRQETDTPVGYPVSCSPQAWAAGAFFLMLEGILGIEPDARARMLRLVQPHLPEQLGFLQLEHMRVGNSRVTLQFHRHGERTMANVLAVEGEPLHVRIDVA